MRILLISIDIALEIGCWILIVFAALHLLRGFGVLDVRDGRVAVLYRTLDRMTAAPLWPVRRMLPDLGGVDISPVILIVVLMTVRYAIALYAIPKLV
jgi:YggT family protein